MSEKSMRQFLQKIEGEDQDPKEFEAEMLAWNHAVLIKDYMKMFRSGVGMATTIYGSPYDSHLRPLSDPGYSDNLAGLHNFLTAHGLETIEVEKPNLTTLFPAPASRAANAPHMFAASDQDQLRLTYHKKFLEMMYGWGYRDITEIGANGYLNQVPDRLSLLTFCAPNATKSFVSQDGYVAFGYDLEPDYERPLSQRGGYGGFLVSGYDRQFEDVTSQLGFLFDHLDRFEFRADDLLGYRPKEMTVPGVAAAWDGWIRAV